MPTDPSTAPIPTATPTSPAATPASAPDVGFAPDGTLTGVDGLLNQIAAALGREAGPLLRDVVLPEIRRDTVLQDRIGAAAGRAAVQELKPVLWTIAGVLGIVAVTYVVKSRRAATPAAPRQLLPPHR